MMLSWVRSTYSPRARAESAISPVVTVISAKEDLTLSPRPDTWLARPRTWRAAPVSCSSATSVRRV